LHVIAGLVPPAKLLLVPLLVDDDRWLWIDTGISSTPQDTLLPYLHAHELRPAPDQAAVITHADVDHFGGLSQLQRHIPGLRAMAHPTDARLIDDQAALMAERYLVHAAEGIVPDIDRQRELAQRGGGPVRIEDQICGGCVVSFGLEVLELPGHSGGHLGVWDAENGRAFIGDAVLGWGIRDLGGELRSPPPYFDVDSYLHTIGVLERLAPDELHTSHLPVMRDGEVTSFLHRSRLCVEAIEDALRSAISPAREGLTLAELSDVVAVRLGCWPANAIAALADPLSAHLAKGLRERSIQVVGGAGTPRYAAI
jgi:glyoxylase-like metal-dependent hydrolase (beta-lactamase superfamily II)